MTAIKHFTSQMGGAPVLSGTPGSLIAVLDACLVDGFDLKSIDNIVVSGGVATATISAGHTYGALQVITIAANSLPSINGDKRVLTSTGTQFTFDATGIPNQTISGTITAKRTSAGWQKVFSGTNLAVYRSQDVTGTRMFLRVDDTGTLNARVVGYESMSDVNTNSGSGFGFPASFQISGGGYWPKANSANNTWRAWTVVADSKTFWLHMHTASASQGVAGHVWGFGDINSYKSGDAYGCALYCASSDLSNNSTANQFCVDYLGPGGYLGVYMPRSFTGLGNANDVRHASESLATSNGAPGTSLSTYLANFPNGPDNGLYFSKKILFENAFALRGRCRGVLFPVQNCHYGFVWRDIIDGQGEFAGRKLMAIKCGGASTTTSNGVMFIDITGPWE